jgi:hypothetical protein
MFFQYFYNMYNQVFYKKIWSKINFQEIISYFFNNYNCLFQHYLFGKLRIIKVIKWDCEGAFVLCFCFPTTSVSLITTLALMLAIH